MNLCTVYCFDFSNQSTTSSQDSGTSTASSNNSWLIAEDAPRPNTSSGALPVRNKSRGCQTNHSLFRQYYEKKDKAVCVRDGPQAFFIECDSVPTKPRPKSAIEHSNRTNIKRRPNCNNANNIDYQLSLSNIIDLETETLPEEKNLQEALRRKRPDYIEKSKTREQDRLAKSQTSGNTGSRGAPVLSSKVSSRTGVPARTSVPQAKRLYDSGNRSKIPQISVRKNGNGNSVSNAKKISMTTNNRTQALKAVQ